jgi:hypothetical protein
MRHFNAARFMQFIKKFVTFSHIKCKFNLFLPIFVNRLERVISIRFSLGRPIKFSIINIVRLVTRAIRITIDIVNIAASMLKIIFIFLLRFSCVEAFC